MNHLIESVNEYFNKSKFNPIELLTIGNCLKLLLSFGVYKLAKYCLSIQRLKQKYAHIPGPEAKGYFILLVFFSFFSREFTFFWGGLQDSSASSLATSFCPKSLKREANFFRLFFTNGTRNTGPSLNFNSSIECSYPQLSRN